ncbi:Kelch repeat-containing protein [Adhaeribacter pallidiroseus]|uniref:Kelch repeat-containing protein n=1 Tax=Adhaeribacter pallidiroseus TaxID=2072847 RepID=UPI001313FB9A|nr:kelch repeat-containing protein [Adhaeribacter pallidiroseus]
MILQANSSFAQWTRRADALKKRSECPSVLYKNKIYIFGGFGEFPNLEQTSEVYDPATNKWTLRASFPSGKKVSHQGVVLVDDKIWHIGGRAVDTNGPVTSQVIIYDITNNRWLNGPQLIDPATGRALPLGGGGAALVGRTLHVFGGFSPTICLDQTKYHLTLDVDKWRANPSGTRWENKSAPMPLARNHFSTVVLNGKIYAIGGQVKHDCGATELNYVHAYDPVNNSWARLSNLPAPRSHNEMGTFPVDGKIYQVGGQGSGDDAQKTVFVFNPDANGGSGAWSNATQYTLPKYYFGVSAKVVGTKLIISHGAQKLVSDERRETYTASFTRHTPYKFGFTAKCFSKSVSSGATIIVKNLLYTVENQKTYSLSSNAGWLTITKNSSGTALPTGIDVEATVNTSGLAAGSYSATVTAKSTGSGTTYSSASFCVNITVGGTSTGSQGVVSFTLINADSDKDIQTLNDGATLDIAKLPAKNLNIRVNTSPSAVGSVKAELTGAQSLIKIESSAPYAVFGESNSNYNAWVPKLGNYTLKATPYSGTSASGTAGSALSIAFQVVNSAGRTASGPAALKNPEPGKPAGIKLNVYPNPGSGTNLQVTLENFTQNEQVSLVMYNALGKVVHTSTLQTNYEGKGALTMPINGLQKGYYIVKAQGTSGSKQAKVIVE